MAIYVTLFLAGFLTILLPCILPLIPVVLGVSIAGGNRLRPLMTVSGMVVSFVLITFLLQVVLSQFVELADIIRLGTYAVLFLFGVAFLTNSKIIRLIGGVLAGLFFINKGMVHMVIAMAVFVAIMEVASRLAGRIQQLGIDAQNKARAGFGDSPLTPFLIGMSLGLVWVPCAGPALGFALALVREEPGLKALLALFAYALGTAVPLLIVGYGGQAAVKSVRVLTRYTGVVKQFAGVLLVATAIALHFNVFMNIQVWLAENTSFSDLGTRLENSLFGEDMGIFPEPGAEPSSDSTSSMDLPTLPKIVRAPEFTGLSTWHNSEPFTLESLKGKVVLVDFWTYSCINCIRTLPYIQGYWEKYKDTGKFVLLGVHTPEFTFEKSPSNVKMAIDQYGLTYPVVQDNDFGTWRAFANRYWPAKYLIDAEGYVRYTHFGEGAYDETDEAIASLLSEAGVDVENLNPGEVASSASTGGFGSVSPETYLGSRSWPAFGNAKGDPTSDAISYAAPVELVLNKYYLSGTWQLVDGEFQVMNSASGEIRMKFQGGENNLVLGLEEGAAPVEATVMIDGKPGKTFTVDRHDLYNLYKGDGGTHDLVLSFKGKGLEAFAFTFGR